MTKRKSKTLYHYCSLHTFKSIMENRSIWLSDIRKSNDSKELLWVSKQCSTLILEIWVNYLNALKEADLLSNISTDHFDEFEKIRSLIDNHDLCMCWAFCLSEKRDDLGQWRGYADDGQGVSIGFSSDFFDIIDILIGRIAEKGELRFQKIKYRKKDIDALFQESIDATPITADLSPDQVLNLCREAVGMAFWLAPFYKNETFKDEKEWRVAYTAVSSDVIKHNMPNPADKDSVVNDIANFKKFGYVVKNQTLVSHLELDLPLLKNIVSSITLGPKCKVTPFEMQMFLASIEMDKNHKGKAIKILRSAASYQ